MAIDNNPPVARWQDYVYPIYVPLPDGLLTGQATWKGNDDLSGIDFFQVQQSENSGVWADVNVKDPGATTAFINEKPGASYRFRVRATDMSGNVGKWSTSPAYALTFVQDGSSAISHDSAWKTTSESGAAGGTVLAASQAGASAQFQFKGDGFGFVTIVGPDRGKVAVYVDGSKVATLDLFANSETTQYVAFSRAWGSVGTHTVKLTVMGTPGRPRVDIDGFETRVTQ